MYARCHGSVIILDQSEVAAAWFVEIAIVKRYNHNDLKTKWTRLLFLLKTFQISRWSDLHIWHMHTISLNGRI